MMPCVQGIIIMELIGEDDSGKGWILALQTVMCRSLPEKSHFPPSPVPQGVWKCQLFLQFPLQEAFIHNPQEFTPNRLQ